MGNQFLGSGIKEKINLDFANKTVESMKYPNFSYTREEKIIRINSILAVNPPDALELIQDILNN